MTSKITNKKIKKIIEEEYERILAEGIPRIDKLQRALKGLDKTRDAAKIKKIMTGSEVRGIRALIRAKTLKSFDALPQSVKDAYLLKTGGKKPRMPAADPKKLTKKQQADKVAAKKAAQADKLPKLDPVTGKVVSTRQKPLAQLKGREAELGDARQALGKQKPLSGPSSGVGAAIRPGMPVPLRGPGSKVFKGRILDDIAKELKMPNYPAGYMNSTEFLLKATGKRRRLGLQNPEIAIPPRPGVPVPVPGTPPWKPWVMSDKARKWLKYAGLTAAAAALLGATSMLTPEEENIIPGPTPTPVPPPGPTPGPGPGPNAEACKTARGVRNLLKKKAEELTGKKGVAALRAIPLKGDDNSWIRDSYRKLWSARKSRSQSEKARLLIVAAWGEDLGCTVADAEDGPGDMITPLTPDVAPDMTPDLDIDPTLKPLPAGAEQTFEEPPEVREDERTKRFKEVYQKRRAMARRAIAKRNKLTDQYVKSYVGRPLRQGETLESWFESQGSKLPAGYTQKVNQYKQFEKKAMAGTANLVVRKLIPALKKLNPNLSKRQLKAFIDDKPITGTGESPADLPQRGQRDTATMGLTAAERAKLDMTGGPPPLQESKQLDRMKLLAGIRNENK